MQRVAEPDEDRAGDFLRRIGLHRLLAFERAAGLPGTRVRCRQGRLRRRDSCSAGGRLRSCRATAAQRGAGSGRSGRGRRRRESRHSTSGSPRRVMPSGLPPVCDKARRQDRPPAIAQAGSQIGLHLLVGRGRAAALVRVAIDGQRWTSVRLRSSRMSAVKLSAVHSPPVGRPDARSIEAGDESRRARVRLARRCFPARWQDPAATRSAPASRV